jgi:HAD superfamily hydrolase (TIGR01484 family)
LYDKIGEEIFPISFLLHEENEEYLFNLRDEINLNFVNLQAVITFKGTLEVFSNLASKGSAIQTICEIENITNMEDVFAVGDAGNDIAMFKVLGKKNSFSMNSALKYVKDYTNISVSNVGDVVDILLK